MKRLATRHLQKNLSFNKFIKAQKRYYDTVAILDQGTDWADAEMQAFLRKLYLYLQINPIFFEGERN